MAIQVSASKLVGEEISMDFDMLSRCKVGETIATAVVTSVALIGVDEEAASMVNGSPSILNNVVTQLIIGGEAGVIYKISCAARSSLNNIYINEAKLAVLPDDASTPA